MNEDQLWLVRFGLMIVLLFASMMVPQGLGVCFAFLKCVLDDFWLHGVGLDIFTNGSL